MYFRKDKRGGRGEGKFLIAPMIAAIRASRGTQILLQQIACHLFYFHLLKYTQKNLPRRDLRIDPTGTLIPWTPPGGN
jgi:hypothetical protein